MAQPVEAIEQLGREMAATLEQLRPERQRAIEQARAQFLEETTPSNRRAFALRVAAAALLTVVAVLGLALSLRDWHRLTFSVNGQDGGLDAWLAAGTQPIDVRFSDGTALHLSRASRARVVDVSHNGASITLESGELHADVVHTGQSAWFLSAGPLSVHVTGTRFDMQWNPTLQEFSIFVSEGSVHVSGSLAGSERTVRGGERLLVSLSDNRMELTRTQPANAPQERGPSPVKDVTQPEASIAPRELLATGPITPKTAEFTWKELLKRGELRAAFASAEQAGFGKACEAAHPAELLALGDAARVSNRADRVSEALLSLRRRFPRDSRSAAAAFALGKVAFDQRHAYAEAADWFATCIREQPHGSLAREAAGRHIEALRAAGTRVAAESAARTYLARYPVGPHAELARSLLR